MIRKIVWILTTMDASSPNSYVHDVIFDSPMAADYYIVTSLAGRGYEMTRYNESYDGDHVVCYYYQNAKADEIEVRATTIITATRKE